MPHDERYEWAQEYVAVTYKAFLGSSGSKSWKEDQMSDSSELTNSDPCPRGTPPVMKNGILPCRPRLEQRSDDSRALSRSTV
jgi:hypothetical protein